VFAGYDALSPQDLIQQANRQFGVLPALRLPLFEGGRLQGQLNERESQRQAAVANYNRTVLQAVRQAGDAIAIEQALKARLVLQRKAGEQGKKVWLLNQERQQAGLVARTTVLSAQLRLNELRRAVAETETQQRAAQIQLTLSLGGGWEDASTMDVSSARQPTP
jgi:outer membrane protein TolC